MLKNKFEKIHEMFYCEKSTNLFKTNIKNNVSIKFVIKLLNFTTLIVN